MLSELRNYAGFRLRRRIEARFERLALVESRRWSLDPRFQPYVDGVFWAARPGVGRFAPEIWLLGDRMYSGWPDPPQWAFWALDGAGEVLIAWDFDDWPGAWRRPPENEAAPGAAEQS